jgi:hypothetical protein
MKPTLEFPSFDQVKHALAVINKKANPAETHGMLCGFIAAGNKMDGKSWIDIILGHTAFKTKKNRNTILALYEVSFEKLVSVEFDFKLLLPSDAEPLPTRAEALSHWCQGFLAGLKLAGIDIRRGVSADSQEALHHLTEISQLDYEIIEISETDEIAFVEVSEYVRMAIILIYTEIMLAQSTKSGASH